MNLATSKTNRLLAASGLGVCLLLAGCTATPKALTEASAASTADPVCEEACSEDDSNRYQYYLGILSVLIMG